MKDVVLVVIVVMVGLPASDVSCGVVVGGTSVAARQTKMYVRHYVTRTA